MKRIAWTEIAKADVRALDKPTAMRVLSGIDHPRQDSKFQFGEQAAAFRETAGYKEEPIRQDQTA